MSVDHYNCRVCNQILAITWEKNCTNCQAHNPWMSVKQLQNYELYCKWNVEEQKHEKIYLDYYNRFMGYLRYKKEINYHMKLAQKAQDEKNKYWEIYQKFT